MSRRASALAAAGAVALAAGLTAFVRTTTVGGHPDQGLCLYWQARGITYYVNMSGFQGSGCASAAAASALVQASIPAWSGAKRAGQGSPCTDLAFTYGGESTDTSLGYDPAPGAVNRNLVVYRKGQCSDTTLVPANDPCHQTVGACAAAYNCWEHGGSPSTLALTTTTYIVQTGQIVDADIELNGWSGNASAPQDGTAGWYFTCSTGGTCTNPPYGQAGCAFIDLGSVVTHEAGHVLGLDHPCVSTYPPPYDACPSPTPVMAPTVTLGSTGNRVLKPDDVEGVCTIYPAGGPTLTTCSGSSAPPGSGSSGGGGGGCSSAGAGLGAIGGLLLALGLRRRR